MKNMQKITKIITIIAIVIMLLTICTSVFADDATSYEPGQWKNQTGNKVDTTDVKAWSSSLINVVAIIGSAAAVIILIILGVKYMMGSAEEKAEYKKTLLPYVIGAVFVFGASALTGAIYNFVGK